MKAEYIDHLGDDLRVVNAARVSFDKESDYIDDGKVDIVTGSALPFGDIRLISYLAKNGHWTPFSHVMVTMRETIPIFLARQRFKHMVGFTYNEVSRRYVDDEPEFFVPDFWRARAANKKQGSTDEVAVHYSQSYELALEACKYAYEALLDVGVCPEQARMVLPQSMYTSYYVTGSLAAWARAYKQRTHEHAQREWDEVCSQWDSVIRPLFPVSWSALVE